MKISFVTTVLNEEKNVELLLNSVIHQTKKPDEIIIVDGGSTDDTLTVISNYKLSFSKKKNFPKIRIFKKKGNRSIGRNFAIEKARGDIILSSDSGCILSKNWVKEIIKPFKNSEVDVVAGYYKGLSKNVFEKSLVSYVLVMPDKTDPKNFLPSSRSVAFTKKIWKKIGGFPKEHLYNEDYVFARKLKEINAKILFRKSAIVYWLPRKNIFESFLMFFKFAYGDAQAGIIRSKVVFLFIRYIILIWFLTFFLSLKTFFILKTIFYILILYVAWSIWKNYKYVKDREAIVILPILQITSDFAVITGTMAGFFDKLWNTKNKR